MRAKMKSRARKKVHDANRRAKKNREKIQATAFEASAIRDQVKEQRATLAATLVQLGQADELIRERSKRADQLVVDAIEKLSAKADEIAAAAAALISDAAETLACEVAEGREEHRALVVEAVDQSARDELAKHYLAVDTDNQRLRVDNAMLNQAVQQLRSEVTALKAKLTSPSGIPPAFLVEAYKRHHHTGFTGKQLEKIVQRILRWAGDESAKLGYFGDPVPRGEEVVVEIPDVSDRTGPLEDLRARLESATSIKEIQKIGAEFGVPGRSEWRSADRDAAIVMILEAASASVSS